MTAADEQTAALAHSSALALSEFRREVSVSLAEIRGDVRLMLQRGEQGERRMDDLARLVTRLDERVDAVERTQVTRVDMEERSKRTLAWTTLIVGIGLGLTATGTTVIISLITP